jgi:hypothetical protein
MATIKNTIKKVEKVTGLKIQTNSNNQHWVEFKGYTLSFFPNGIMSEEAQAISFYTKKIGSEDNYHSGIFHDNAIQALGFISRN